MFVCGVVGAMEMHVIIVTMLWGPRNESTHFDRAPRRFFGLTSARRQKHDSENFGSSKNKKTYANTVLSI